MQDTRKSDLIRGYFDAYRTKDRRTMEAALAGDFTFTSPCDDAIDKAEYFRRCWPNRHRIRDCVIQRIARTATLPSSPTS